MAIVHKLFANGGFAAHDTESGRSAYAYPTSSNAVRARKAPDKVAAAMIEQANNIATAWSSPFMQEIFTQYDKRIAAVIDGTHIPGGMTMSRKQPKGKAYTVVFYIDGDCLEMFTEEVWADDPYRAFDKAKWKAKRSGCSSSGHSIPDSEWENATEIATFHGHGLSAY